MAEITFLERLNGFASLLKAEFIDAPLSRGTFAPEIDIPARVILLTGATSGIGRETARQLARSGATLIVTARDIRRGEKLVQELITETLNPRISCRYLDLCDFESINAAAEAIRKDFNRLDILINCAGLGSFVYPKYTKDGNEFMLQTNYLGPYLLTEKLLPLLIASGTSKQPARIVNVASEAHYACPTFTINEINNIAIPPEAQYVHSKFLLISSTMALADRLKHERVVVHAVCPGMTMTEFFENFPKGQQIIFRFAGLFLGKSVEEAAANVVLVATSEESQKCTGVYWANMAKHAPHPKVYDKMVQKGIVARTNQLVGL